MSKLDFSAIKECTTTVLDLFCGVGGFSVGFDRAGYDVVAGVDVDGAAIRTYDENHNSRAIEQDLTELTAAQFAETYDIHSSDVDIVIGGPPCQGFSRANIDRSLDDERCNLVFVFAECVDYYEPDVFLMENVKGIQTGERKELFGRLLDNFRDSGYTVEWRVLNAADYGVPQTRERVFVQGVLDGEPSWPEPTHAPSNEISKRYEEGNGKVVEGD